jgi:hypothetical protein
MERFGKQAGFASFTASVGRGEWQAVRLDGRRFVILHVALLCPDA